MTKCDLNIHGENMHEMADRSELSAKLDALLPAQQPSREDVRNFQEKMQRRTNDEGAPLDDRKADGLATPWEVIPTAKTAGSFWERIFGQKNQAPTETDGGAVAMPDGLPPESDAVNLPAIDGQTANGTDTVFQCRSGQNFPATAKVGSPRVQGRPAAGKPDAGTMKGRTGSEHKGSMPQDPSRVHSPRCPLHGSTVAIITGDSGEKLVSRGGISTRPMAPERPTLRMGLDNLAAGEARPAPVRTGRIRSGDAETSAGIFFDNLRNGRRLLLSSDAMEKRGKVPAEKVEPLDPLPNAAPVAKGDVMTQRTGRGEHPREQLANLLTRNDKRKDTQVAQYKGDNKDHVRGDSVKQSQNFGETLDFSTETRQDKGVKILTPLSVAEDRYAQRSMKASELMRGRPQFQFDRKSFSRERTRSADEKKRQDDGLDQVIGLPQPNTTGLAASGRAMADVQPHTIRELCQQLVDQITVHQALLATKQEVHVQLKGAMFAGSEVVISKDGGTLLVNFHAADDSVGRLLVHNQQGLRDHLLETLNLDSVKIDVHGQGERGADEGSAEQQRQRQDEERRAPFGEEMAAEDLKEIAEA